MISIKQQTMVSFLYAYHIIHLIACALLLSALFYHILDRFLFERNNP